MVAITMCVKVEKGGATDPNENKFQYLEYEGKKGLRLSKTLSIRYPSARPANTQFVFVGLFTDKVSFRFDQASRHVLLSFAAPFVEAKDSANRLSTVERSQNLPNLPNKKVIFTAKFASFGVLCNLINITDKTAYNFNFTPQNLLFTTVSLSPPKQGSFMPEFFGLNKGDAFELLHKFFLEEIYRN
jgi:hypothetical protein